jgi:protein-S-isoprenylcysteine O-methyltransferase Ste14
MALFKNREEMYMKKDVFTLLGGFLTSVLLFLGTVGVSFEWLTQASIDAFVFMLAAAVALAVNLYAVWKNTNVVEKLKSNKQRRDL